MSLHFDRVTFTYPAADSAAIVDLSLAVERGAVTWLFGPLDAGTSTLLLLAGGFAPLLTGGERQGRVRALDLDPGDVDARALLAGRVAYVSAQPHLQLSGLAETVFEEVAFAPANLEWPRERIAVDVPHALARVNAGHLADRAPAELSGGELQRVVIAAMLVLRPELWLLDDPASALDPAARSAAYALFREESRRGATVVLATEDADGALEVADRIVVLDRGRIVMDGPPAEVVASDACWSLGAGSTSVGEVWRAAMEREPAMRPGPVPLTIAEALARVEGR